MDLRRIGILVTPLWNWVRKFSRLEADVAHWKKEAADRDAEIEGLKQELVEAEKLIDNLTLRAKTLEMELENARDQAQRAGSGRLSDGPRHGPEEADGGPGSPGRVLGS